MNTIEYTFIPETRRPMTDLEMKYIRNQCVYVDFPVLDSFEVLGKKTPFESAEESNRLEVLYKVMRSLDSKGRKVLKMRFDFYGQEYTSVQIADDLDIMLEAVRQVQIKTIPKLKANKQILEQL